MNVVGTMFFKDNKLLIDKPRKRPTYQMIGGKVEDGESPLQAAIRECQEEVGLVISLENIIHEDSNIDNNKIFTRLVYSANLLQNENINIKLDPEEHVEYKWIKNLDDLDGESIVPYLYDIMK